MQSALKLRDHDDVDLGARYCARRGVYSFPSNDLLRSQEGWESNARSYPRRIPLALRRGQGIYLEDTDGRVFMDCLSVAGAMVLGHNHPVVVEAIERALRDGLPMQTLDLTTPVKEEFVQELLASLPNDFGRRCKIQFCGPTGTDAVEAALKLVRTATGRGNILAFHGAYHGMSLGSLALMGNLGPKRFLGGAAPNVQFLPYPYDYRCPFGLGGEAGERAGLEYIRTVLNDPESGVLPAAGMIVEVVQGEGGVIPASVTWLRELSAMARAAGVPLIVDEVQTGFGRTGKPFAFQHAGIVPDVLVLSKAIGAGLPLSVVVYDESLDKWAAGAHAGTFRGNQLAMAAGTAAMKFLRAQRLDRYAERVGARLRSHLDKLRSRYACVGEVRGRGLMLGIELVDPRGEKDRLGHPPGSPALARDVQRVCLKNGLILESGGRHGSTLRFLPPLIVTETEIDTAADIVASALQEVTGAIG